MGLCESVASLADAVTRSKLTPPFPAYTSGHSTSSAAGAAVLANFFGTDAVSFTTTSDDFPGVSRSFSSFSAAAAEAGISRVYGGIHWQYDNVDGLTSGAAVGNYVAQNFLRSVS
jgi:membrane-associated phospholipid phosphatase